MIYPSADNLDEWGSKYALVTLAAKRAKQIKAGVRPLIQTDSRNPLTIALEEIASGKITCVVADNDDLIKPIIEQEFEELFAIPTGMNVEDEESIVEEIAVNIDDEDEFLGVVKEEAEVEDIVVTPFEDEEELPLTPDLDEDVDDSEDEKEPKPLDEETEIEITENDDEEWAE